MRARRMRRRRSAHVAPFALVLLVSLVVEREPSLRAQDTARAATARLSGVVVADDTGAPLFANLRALGAAESPIVATDDDGAFEFVLPPGAYLITALAPGYVTGTVGQRLPTDRPTLIELGPGDSRHLEVRLVPLGRITGRILDEAGMPVVGAEVIASSERAGTSCPPRCVTMARGVSDAEGRYQMEQLPAGRYHVLAVHPDPASSPARAPASPAGLLRPVPSAPVTYYPGTSRPEQAAPVVVTPGTQLEVSFGLVPSTPARIAGSVVGAGGGVPPDTFVMLVPRPPQPSSAVPRMTELTADGRFEFTNVPLGEYLLAVRNSSKFIAIAETGGRITTPFSGEMADVRVAVPSEGLDDLRIATAPGFDVEGRVLVDGQPARDLPRMTIAVLPVDHLTSAPSAAITVANADGSFRLPNVTGRLLVAPAAPAGFMVQRVLAGSTDITDEGVDVLQHTEIDIVLVRPTELTGRVMYDDAPVPGITVVAFAQNPALWSLRRTRHIRSTTAMLDGTFRMEGLPAGSYYVAASPSMVEGESTDIDLELLIPRAARVDIGDGDRQAVTVRMD